jgi:hypothetical protein
MKVIKCHNINMKFDVSSIACEMDITDIRHRTVNYKHYDCSTVFATQFQAAGTVIRYSSPYNRPRGLEGE